MGGGLLTIIRTFWKIPFGAAAVGAGLILLAGCGGKTGIQVVSATYGASCGAPAGNATGDLKGKCDGQEVCNYTVDVTVLGDPKQACAKDYEARWTCGSNSEVHVTKLPAEAGFGGKTLLSCPTNQ